MRLNRTWLTALGALLALVGSARAQVFTGVNGPNVFMTHYYDVATSSSPSASGYGGAGASGGIGDGLVRIVNGGNVSRFQRGTLCAMIYVFDDIEEMQACCGCPVTPDGLRTMSVINNVTKNFGVNRGNLNAGVIDIASVGTNLFLPNPVPLPPQIGAAGSTGWACDPSFQFGAQIGGELTPTLFVDGLRAWINDTEGNVPVPARSGALIKGTSVGEFQFATLDVPHFDELENLCLFLVENGSGAGACSCGSGDDFSITPGPSGG